MEAQMTGIQLTSIFCFVDDFCKKILPELKKSLIGDGRKTRVRTDCLSESEIITILLWFNLSGFNCFKHFYLSYQQNLRQPFPRIPCYERFVILQKKSFMMTKFCWNFSLLLREKLMFITSIPPSSKSARINESTVIKPLKDWLQEVSQVVVGSTDLNFIWSQIILEKLFLLQSRRAMFLIKIWLKNLQKT